MGKFQMYTFEHYDDDHYYYSNNITRAFGQCCIVCNAASRIVAVCYAPAEWPIQ